MLKRPQRRDDLCARWVKRYHAKGNAGSNVTNYCICDRRVLSRTPSLSDISSRRSFFTLRLADDVRRWAVGKLSRLYGARFQAVRLKYCGANTSGLGLLTRVTPGRDLLTCRATLFCKALIQMTSLACGSFTILELSWELEGIGRLFLLPGYWRHPIQTSRFTNESVVPVLQLGLIYRF